MSGGKAGGKFRKQIIKCWRQVKIAESNSASIVLVAHIPVTPGPRPIDLMCAVNLVADVLPRIFVQMTLEMPNRNRTHLQGVKDICSAHLDIFFTFCLSFFFDSCQFVSVKVAIHDD